VKKLNSNYIKILSKTFRILNLNFNIPNEWSRKMFQESNIWGFVSRKQKNHVFHIFLIF